MEAEAPGPEPGVAHWTTLMPAAFPVAASKQELEEGRVLAPRFGADGLVTAVAADAETGEVLMVAHMNAEALARTLCDRRGLVLVALARRALAQGRDERPGPERRRGARRLRPGRRPPQGPRRRRRRLLPHRPALVLLSSGGERLCRREERRRGPALTRGEAVAVARALTDRAAKHDVVGVGRSFRERGRAPGEARAVNPFPGGRGAGVRGTGRGTDGAGRLRRQRCNPSPGRRLRAVSTSPSGRGGARQARPAR